MHFAIIDGYIYILNKLMTYYIYIYINLLYNLFV